MRTAFAWFVTLASVGTAAADTPEDRAVWKDLRPAMLAFQAGGTRDAFRDTCNELRHAYPHTRYTAELSSLSAALDSDARTTEPALSPTATADDAARYWVYELRDVAGQQISDPGEPMLFAAAWGHPPNAADRLVALGPAAIPRLVEALGDDTPTRTIAWQRSFYPVYFVLRRRDVALKVLERITGAHFYEEGATYMHYYMDTPARQQSVRDNVAAWWDRSRGATQLQMIANQLALMHTNSTLGEFDRVQMLRLLGELDGPEAVLPELRRLYADDRSGLNSEVASTLAELDPQTPVRAVLARFWADQSRDGDYATLYPYGDARAYAEIARRLARTGKLDPGEWNLSDQAREAAQYGQGWAIPVLAQLLADTQMTGSRYRDGAAQSFSTADDAVEQLAKLTGVDFGYRADASEADRLVAIANARRWWEHGGEAAMRDKIGAPHAVAVDDLLRSDVELAATARAIADPGTRRSALAHLGATRSYVVQRALVDALPRAIDDADRRAILSALQPTLWALPAIVGALVRSGDVTTRVLAASRVTDVLRASPAFVRLELRDAELARVQAVADDAAAPAEVRAAAARVLAGWSGLGERPI